MDEDFVTEDEAHMRLALELILAALCLPNMSDSQRLQRVYDVAVQGLGGPAQADMVLGMTVWKTAGSGLL